MGPLCQLQTWSCPGTGPSFTKVRTFNWARYVSYRPGHALYWAFLYKSNNCSLRDPVFLTEVKYDPVSLIAVKYDLIYLIPVLLRAVKYGPISLRAVK